MKLEYAVIAQSHEVLPTGELQFAGHLPRVTVLDERHPFSLGNHKLYFAMSGEEIVAGNHTMRVVLRGARGEEARLIDDQPGVADHDGIIFGMLNFGPETAANLPGTYEFIFTLDGVEVGVQKFEVVRATGPATATFHGYRQAQEGIAQGEGWVRGTLGFDVFNDERHFGHFGVGIWQPQGSDIIEDELHLVLPSPSFDSPSFHAAVRKAHDHYLSMLGLRFTKVSEITMSDNIFSGSFQVNFEFAEPAGITASDAW